MCFWNLVLFRTCDSECGFIYILSWWKHVSTHCFPQIVCKSSLMPLALIIHTLIFCSGIKDTFFYSDWSKYRVSLIATLTHKIWLLGAFLCPQGIDDATLRRFLRARSLNVEKAYKFLLRHLQWKSEFMPEGFIRSSEVQNELKKEKIYLQGVDKRGRPIGVILANKHRSSEREFKSKSLHVFFTVPNQMQWHLKLLGILILGL